MCDQIKSYYCTPAGRLQYNTWKYRNDSKQIRSNLKWDPKMNSNISTYVTHNSLPRRVNTAKTKLKKTIISDNSRKKQNTKINYPAPNCHKKCEYKFNDSPLKKYVENNLKFDEQILGTSNFKVDLSDYNYDSDEYSSGSLEGGLFLNRCEPDDLEELKSFRDKFYFECHSLDAKSKNYTQPDKHICQHQFIINDRLFPEPLYADHDKNSRCHVCHLPLINNSKEFVTSNDENYEISKKIKSCQKGKAKDAKKESEATKNDCPEIILRLPYDKFKDVAIPQKFISKTCDNSTVKKCGNIISKSFTKKIEIPSDSLALRYQKGFREKMH